MVNVSVLACMMCVVLMATAATAQRPFYAPNPWYDQYGQQEQFGSGSAGVVTSTPVTRPPPPTRAPASSSGSSNGLGDRFLIPVSGSVSFRFYDNVAIQGPEAPCIGCIYMLTRNGFIRQF